MVWTWLWERLWGAQGCINEQGKSRSSNGGVLHTPTRARSDCSASDQLQPPKYIYSDGKPVGIANTVSKYQENRPVKRHMTPFETRVEAKMAEEERLTAAADSSGDSIRASSGADATTKQLFMADPSAAPEP